MRETYRFDPKTITYKKVEKNTAWYLRVGILYLITGGLLATGFVFLFYKVYDSPKTRQLKAQQAQLVEAELELKPQLAYYQILLDSLRMIDKGIYRVILNADPPQDEDEVLAGAVKRVEAGDLQEIEDQINSLLTQIHSEATNAMLREVSQMSENELRQIPAIRPVRSEIISGFGMRKHPIQREDRMHNGIDLKADLGTDVMATADGYVLQTGIKNNGMGQYISIRHNNEYTTVYAHLSKINVYQGKKVKRGDVIGQSGNSGLCKGPHLYYEVQRKGKPVDPIDFFFLDLTPDQYQTFRNKSQEYNESMN